MQKITIPKSCKLEKVMDEKGYLIHFRGLNIIGNKLICTDGRKFVSIKLDEKIEKPIFIPIAVYKTALKEKTYDKEYIHISIEGYRYWINSLEGYSNPKDYEWAGRFIPTAKRILGDIKPNIKPLEKLVINAEYISDVQQALGLKGTLVELRDSKTGSIPILYMTLGEMQTLVPIGSFGLICQMHRYWEKKEEVITK